MLQPYTNVGKKRKRISKGYRRPKKYRKLTPSNLLIGRTSITEVKCCDTCYALSTTPGTGLIDIPEFAAGSLTSGATYVSTHINNVSQGTTMSQRVGNKINMKSVSVRLTIGYKNTAAVTYKDRATVRVMLVYDKQPNATYPAYSDILQDTSTNATNTNSFNSNINITQKNRFVMVKDKFINFDLNHQIEHVKMFKKLNNTETSFKSTTGAISDIINGALYLIVFKSQNISAVDNAICAYDIATRIRYID